MLNRFLCIRPSIVILIPLKSFFFFLVHISRVYYCIILHKPYYICLISPSISDTLSSCIYNQPHFHPHYTYYSSKYQRRVVIIISFRSARARGRRVKKGDKRAAQKTFQLSFLSLSLPQPRVLVISLSLEEGEGEEKRLTALGVVSRTSRPRRFFSSRARARLGVNAECRAAAAAQNLSRYLSLSTSTSSRTASLFSSLCSIGIYIYVCFLVGVAPRACIYIHIALRGDRDAAKRERRGARRKLSVNWPRKGVMRGERWCLNYSEEEGVRDDDADKRDFRPSRRRRKSGRATFSWCRRKSFGGGIVWWRSVQSWNSMGNDWWGGRV